MDLKTIITAAALSFVSIFSLISAEKTGDYPVQFKDGEKVLFLGDSITRGGGWHSMLSLFYETRFPEKRITWLNAGISGDTAAGALKRLQWDVLDRKPDQVVVMFGMNDIDMLKLYDTESPEKLAARQARIKEYAASMEQLILAMKAAKIKLVLCTQSPYDESLKLDKTGYAGANAALTRCAAICKELAAKYAQPLVDFNGPMNAMALDFQKTNPTFTLIGGDRVHPGAMGNTMMAYLFLKAQNVPGIISETVIDAATGKLVSAGNATVTELSASSNAVSFTLKENALPMPFEGESRETLHLLPFEKELNRQILTISGLAGGEYELLIDEKPVGRWWQDELAAGVNLAGLRTMPQYQQARQVADANAKRHQLASYGPRMIAF
ncbi:MAG: SGNH/GDSL hydrolase family protein, partial [Victivallales bacterium]